MEPRRRLQRVDERRDRLVPQGLRAARTPTPRWHGRSASSRSTTARRSGSTASRSARTPAPTCRSSSSRAASSAAGRTGSWCAWTPAPVTDFPPAGLNTDGVPTGGWWNYSGIQREVYLRKLDTVDFRKVLVRPVLPAAPAPRRPGADQPQERHPQRPAGDDHGQVRQPEPAAGTKTIGPDGIMEFADNIRVGNPRLWAPAARTSTTSASPCASAARRSRATRSRAASARSRSPTAAWSSTGRRSTRAGSGCTRTPRPRASRSTTPAARSCVNQAKELGATSMRTHYPLHPYTHELADRLGC